MTKIYIKPCLDKDGKPYRVRNHNKPDKFLKEDGEFVVLDKHWQRRLNDGSVEKATPPKAPAKTDKTTTTAKG